jgi:RNA polymerase sigma factor (sigma-70 family)
MTEPHDTITELVREAYIDAPQPDFDVQAGLADMHTRIDRAGILGAHVQVADTALQSATASGGSSYADSGYAEQRQTPTVGVGTVDGPAWRELSGSERYAACLHSARAGNREALAALVEDLTPLVWHVARGHGLDRVNAEDVVQTVWLALFSHINTLAEPRALAGWLITATRREAQRVRGRAGSPSRLIDEVAAVIDSDTPDPAEQAVRSDRDGRLWRAFAQLPHKCQELLRLTVLAGRAEYRLVAEAMQMPRGSIGPTRGRCLTTLRELLDAQGGGA